MLLLIFLLSYLVCLITGSPSHHKINVMLGTRHRICNLLNIRGEAIKYLTLCSACWAQTVISFVAPARLLPHYPLLTKTYAIADSTIMLVACSIQANISPDSHVVCVSTKSYEHKRSRTFIFIVKSRFSFH